MKSSEKSLVNAQRALQALSRFVQRADASDELQRAGVVQAFEFTFEATWKLLQKFAAAQGIMANTPKKAFAVALQAGLTLDEDLLLRMLEHRNLTTHTYNEPLAKVIYAAITSEYFAALEGIIHAVAAQDDSRL